MGGEEGAPVAGIETVIPAIAIPLARGKTREMVEIADDLSH